MNFTKVLILTMTMLLTVSVTSPVLASAGDNHSESEQRGPKGGKLLSSENFDVEITIYESGIPPEMRVYAYKNGELLKPQNLELEVQLHRLGGVTDQLTFTSEDDYLVSNQIVTEPHSYEVAVTASSSGATESWRYESFEGRAKLSDRVINKADIRVENATAQTLVFKERLFGVIAPVNDRIAHVRATYRGEVTRVLVDIGERVTAGQTLAVITNATSGTRYEVRSPLDGEVTERFINQGEIAAEQVLFEIVDLSKVWVELSAFPENIEKLQVGQAAEVFDLHQHQRVFGEISYIAPVMTGGHIARARVLVDNEAGHWRPGMHVQADVITDKKTVELAVNQNALQTFRGMPVVFAQYGNTFEVRMVELGQSDGDYVEVLSGLAPNTPYVIGNSYVLKADILKDGASHNH